MVRRVHSLHVIFAMIVTFSASGLASGHHPAASSEQVRRDGHKLVRLHLTSVEQLQAVYDLGAELWSCEPALGGPPVDFVAAPEILEALRAIDSRLRVLSPDIQAEIDAERARLSAQQAERGEGDGGEGPGWFADFKTWPQVNDFMDALVAQRPDLITKYTIGHSIENRPIYGFRLTGPPANPPAVKPAIAFNGCQHAREWISVMVPPYIAQQLIEQYDSNPRIHNLMNAIEIYIVPIANPDGYEFTYAPNGDRMWRKNRRHNGNNIYGVDLNRNWSVDWNGGQGTSTNPSSQTYVGTAPFSEPETAALRDFVMARPNIVGHIDFHSYGQLVLQPLGYTNTQPVRYRMVDRISGILNAGIHAANGPGGLSYYAGTGGTLLYLASGVCRDWMLVERGIFGHTVELRNTSTFLLPPSQIMPTCLEAFEGVLRMAEWAQEGVHALFTRGQPITIEAGAATTFIGLELHPLSSGVLNPSSAKIYTRLGGGAWSASALTHIGSTGGSGHEYQGTLPAAPCGTVVQYYIEVESSAGVTYRSPLNAPSQAWQAKALSTQSIFHDNFQTTMGWTATGVAAGAWQRGVPVNDPNWPYDPVHDSDGSGQCYLTQNATGNTGVKNGSVILTSPIIDMSDTGNAGISISYDYFLRMSHVNGSDRLLAEINSTGGSGTWTPIALHNTDGSLNWRRHEITPAHLAGLGVNMTSQMRVRFTATDASPQTIVEAGLDNFRVRRVMCDTSTCPADITVDGMVNVNDLLAVINGWGACPAPSPGGLPMYCAADISPPGGNGLVNVNDLLVVINGWGPCP